MEDKDWTKYKDFDDLRRDLTAGDFKSILFEMRFNPEKAEQRGKEQDGTPRAIG